MRLFKFFIIVSVAQAAGIMSAHGDAWYCLGFTGIAWLLCDLWFMEKK